MTHRQRIQKRGNDVNNWHNHQNRSPSFIARPIGNNDYRIPRMAREPANMNNSYEHYERSRTLNPYAQEFIPKNLQPRPLMPFKAVFYTQAYNDRIQQLRHRGGPLEDLQHPLLIQNYAPKENVEPQRQDESALSDEEDIFNPNQHDVYNVDEYVNYNFNENEEFSFLQHNIANQAHSSPDIDRAGPSNYYYPNEYHDNSDGW